MPSPAPKEAYYDNITIINLEDNVSSENRYPTSDSPLSLVLEVVFNFTESPKPWSWSRAYKAHWELSEGKLYLTDLDGTILNKKISVNSLFSNAISANGSNQKVFAHWYSGGINIMMNYQHKKIGDGYFDCITSRTYKIDKGILLDFSEKYEESKSLPF